MNFAVVGIDAMKLPVSLDDRSALSTSLMSKVNRRNYYHDDNLMGNLMWRDARIACNTSLLDDLNLHISSSAANTDLLPATGSAAAKNLQWLDIITAPSNKFDTLKASLPRDIIPTTLTPKLYDDSYYPQTSKHLSTTYSSSLPVTSTALRDPHHVLPRTADQSSMYLDPNRYP